MHWDVKYSQGALASPFSSAQLTSRGSATAKRIEVSSRRFFASQSPAPWLSMRALLTVGELLKLIPKQLRGIQASLPKRVIPAVTYTPAALRLQCNGVHCALPHSIPFLYRPPVDLPRPTPVTARPKPCAYLLRRLRLVEMLHHLVVGRVDKELALTSS